MSLLGIWAVLTAVFGGIGFTAITVLSMMEDCECSEAE